MTTLECDGTDHHGDAAQSVGLGICASTTAPLMVALAGSSASISAKLARGRRAMAKAGPSEWKSALRQIQASGGIRAEVVLRMMAAEFMASILHAIRAPIQRLSSAMPPICLHYRGQLAILPYFNFPPMELR